MFLCNTAAWLCLLTSVWDKVTKGEAREVSRNGQDSKMVDGEALCFCGALLCLGYIDGYKNIYVHMTKACQATKIHRVCICLSKELFNFAVLVFYLLYNQMIPFLSFPTLLKSLGMLYTVVLCCLAFHQINMALFC